MQCHNWPQHDTRLTPQLPGHCQRYADRHVVNEYPTQQIRPGQGAVISPQPSGRPERYEPKANRPSKWHRCRCGLCGTEHQLDDGPRQEKQGGPSPELKDCGRREERGSRAHSDVSRTSNNYFGGSANHS